MIHLGGVDEVESVIVVLFDAGGDGENVGVEDDVLGIEADFVDEDVVGAFADADLFFVGGGLAVFVEGHDHGSSSVAHDVAGVVFEDFFPFFEGDGVDDAFALQVFEAFGDDFPFGGINHDGDLGDVGLGLHEVEEATHHRDAVDEAVVEADVDDVGSVFDLLAGDFEGVFEFVFLDEFAETGGTGDVGAFPDHEEVFVGSVVVGVGAGEAEEAWNGHWRVIWLGGGGWMKFTAKSAKDAKVF